MHQWKDDPLADFDARDLMLEGVTKKIYTAGSGPAVIVMAEMPGISPHVARFSRWVRDAGFTVYMPSLFGRDGAVPTVEEGLPVLQRACVRAEFRAMVANETSPVTSWLRALARLAHAECGRRGVGAIGMCFTGNFALTMMLEPAVLAPVLSQPSLPLNDPAALEIDPEDLTAVRARLERDDLTVLAYRFAGDRFCTADRFCAYANALGDRFVPRVLPDSAANRETTPFFQQVVTTPHSVVTAHLIDEAGEPTLAARDEILAFFARRLLEPRSSASITVSNAGDRLDSLNPAAQTHPRMNSRTDFSSEWDPIDDALYLDTAAHAVMPRVAADAAAAAIEANKRPYRVDDATFFDVSDGLRSAIATLLGGSAHEVALTTGASTGLQVIAQNLDWRPGDGVVLAGGDFPLHYAVWKPMEARVGAQLTIVAPPDGELSADDVIGAMTSRTRVVSLSHVRFDTGAVLDAGRIAAACRASGAWFILDISQSCGAVETSVRELGADAVVCAGYKWLLGPYGTGFLWVRDERLDQLLPAPFYWTGQSAATFASLQFDRPEPARDAKRFDAAESATQLNLNLAAFRASVDLVLRIGSQAVLDHGLDLIDALFAQLPAHCAPASPLDRNRRGAFGSFTAGSAEATAALHQRLRAANVFVSLRQGKIRVAPHLFNSSEQIGMLLNELHGSGA